MASSQPSSPTLSHTETARQDEPQHDGNSNENQPQQQPQQQPPPHPSSPVPPPVPVETHPNRAGGLKGLAAQQRQQHHNQQQQLDHGQRLPDPSRLAPEDAYFAQSSPPRLRSVNVPPLQHQHQGGGNNHAASLRVPSSAAAAVAALRPPPAVPGSESKENWREGSTTGAGSGSGSGAGGRRKRRRKRQWKKLLWVKQAYPDNYTDTETFLDHLQRNPRLRPYDFWPLIADFTVIVQHVCSVVIFVCCFAVIFQERVSPVAVVSWGSICTILGWTLWDFWVGLEHREAEKLAAEETAEAEAVGVATDAAAAANAADDSASSTSATSNGLARGLGLALNDLRGKTQSRRANSRDNSASATASSLDHNTSSNMTTDAYPPLYGGGSNTPSSSSSVTSGSSSSSSSLSPRNRQRVGTAKSAILIFCALQGLSPILKSLTKSTTSDSIWAMSCWLMVINIFFFDYSGDSNKPSSSTSNDEAVGATTTGGGSGSAAKFPASLSTNAALMASTVLASRLRSTTHVFSLTLFSIEVFGLFPVFRRQLRAISWNGHVLLTVALVIFASGAVGITLRGGFGGAILGILIGAPATGLAMGGCSWWLIGLQRYKNVVTGPWDTAKPVLRRWD